MKDLLDRVCRSPVISGGAVIEGGRQRVLSQLVGYGSPGVDSILDAVADIGSPQVITTGFKSINQPGRVTATAGGTTADIKNIQVIVEGLDPNDLAITETLPAFTLNTAGTVTGKKVFQSVTQVTIPAHDGTGATTSVGLDGSPGAKVTDGVMSALTDTGVEQIINAGANINGLDSTRNITATAGGTAGDIGAISVTIEGKDLEGNPISEVLPAFTADAAGTVEGDKAFSEVTKITVPAHDGTGATTAVGYGNKLGLELRLKRNTVNAAYLNNVIQSTPPTVVINADNLEDNTALLADSLNATPVRLDYTDTPEA